uniref:WD repeat domain 70 n=1 Tax=Canis lupus familiaris TaxID=9615 RepID=A0A8P0PPZ4_CANLF
MERPGPSEVTGSDASGPDPQLAVTMGFTGFGKKARTFDLEAMFEQTRRTAVERSRKTLGKKFICVLFYWFKCCIHLIRI